MQILSSFKFLENGNKRTTIINAGTILVCIISILVFTGWLLQVSVLKQIVPGFAPMQPNTVLGLFTCAFALQLFYRNKPKWKYIVAIIPLLLGILTLAEYVFDTNLGIDLWLFKNHLLSQRVFPGRLAPITAICFWLFAQALLISQIDKRTPVIWSGVIATILASIAFVAILGYFINTETTYGWRSFTSMALHSAVCFAILGLSLLLYISKRLEALNVSGFNWAVILLGITLLTASINFSIGLNNTENQNIKTATYSAAQSSKTFISEKINDITLALSRFASRLEVQLDMPSEALTSDGIQHMLHENSYATIALIKDSKVTWRIDNPKIAGVSNLTLVSLPLKTQANKESGSYIVNTLNTNFIYICIPVIKTTPTPQQYYIIGILDIKQLINNTFINPSFNNTFYISVEHNKALVYENSVKDTTILNWSQSTKYLQNNIVLTINSTPTKQTLANFKSILPNIAFQAGIILAALSMLLAYSIQNLFFHNKHISKLNTDLSEEIEERKTTEEILQNEIRERVQVEARLEEALKELQRSNYDLERFAYAVSHDLKGPLKGISQIVLWLKQDIINATPDTEESLALLNSRLTMMHALIDGLLEYSAVGKKSIKKNYVLLNNLVEETIQSLVVPERVEIVIKNILPEIIANEVLMVQLFQNLINNAIKYNDKPKGLITISSTTKGNFHEFCIEDNGRGIPPQFHETIFIIFNKLESRDEIEGSGIGLATVKRIVEEYNGNISVESEPGKYTRFIFTLYKSA